jgi:hypothetical protein
MHLTMLILTTRRKFAFMRGLNSKIRTMMMTCPNATYHEAVNIAIAYEEEYRKHKEEEEECVLQVFC